MKGADETVKSIKRLKPFCRCIKVFALSIATVISLVIGPVVKTYAVSPPESSSAEITENTYDEATQKDGTSKAESGLNTDKPESSFASGSTEAVVVESDSNSGEDKSNQDVPKESKSNLKQSSAPKFSIDTIADGLGVVKDFAVFAQYYTMSCHMEGNIAVNNFEVISGNVGNSNKVFKNIGKFNLNISIDAGSLNVGRTYSVYIFDNPNRTGNPVFKKELTITDANGSEHITATGLDASKVYYVFLLDSQNNIISQSNVTGEQAVSSSNDSYIKNVIAFKDEVFQPAGDFQQRVVFGNDYRLNSSTDPQKTYQTTGDGTYILIRKNDGKALGKIGGGTNNKVSIATESFPIDFDGIFTRLNSLSSELSSGDFNSNVKVINAELKSSGQNALRNALLEALHESDINYLDKTGIPLGEDQYLVININCNGYSSVTIPQCKIGGVDYASWDEKSVIAGRVIWNFFNKDRSGNYTPYSGNVNENSGMLGTILAPEAEVIVNSSMTGAIYAHKVKNPGGEIHKMTFWPSKTVTRNLNFNIPYSLTVKKVWSDNNDAAHKRPSQIIIDLYHSESGDAGIRGTLLQTVTIKRNADGSWPEYTFTNLPNSGFYKVVERPVDGYVSNTTTSKKACGDIITITNTYLPTYTLPSVGGIGTDKFTSTGLVSIISAALFLIILRRRDKALIS